MLEWLEILSLSFWIPTGVLAWHLIKEEKKKRLLSNFFVMYFVILGGYLSLLYYIFLKFKK